MYLRTCVPHTRSRKVYKVKESAIDQKLRGGYYTPKIIADFLADWAIQTPTTTVLEPSCGDGKIVEAAVTTLLKRKAEKSAIAQLVYGIELNEQEAAKTTVRLQNLEIPLTGQIYNGDFFSYCRDRFLEQVHFDAVVGNPPFVRYQSFPEEQRIVAFALMRQAGMKPTRLTNTWVPFLVASTMLLKAHGGRMAMIIPAELLQVNYAAELRQFLTDQYSKITLITFKKLVFEGIQQEVVLFLGERNGDERTGMRTIELEGIDDLIHYQHTRFLESHLKVMDHSRDKWTQYFLEQPEIDLLKRFRNDKRLTLSGKVLDVDVGVVTGLNEYFIVSQRKAEELRLLEYTQPVVTRSAHLPGIIFTPENFELNAASDYACRLLKAPLVPLNELPPSVKNYVVQGEKNLVHTGYKCRIRERWYVVPSMWRPDGFMLRQIHLYPKIIVNRTEATSTDTIHRVRFISDLPPTAIAAAFLNSLTFAFSEIVGRSYGGGVLELEPNEAENLPLPLNNAHLLDFDHINTLLLAGKIEDVLDITDRVLLIDGLGMNVQEVEHLRGIWYKLRDRRINRKHKKGAELQLMVSQ